MSQKDDNELTDKTQLHFTIFRQRKLINRMKLVMEMNKRRLKKCRAVKQFSKGTSIKFD